MNGGKHEMLVIEGMNGPTDGNPGVLMTKDIKGRIYENGNRMTRRTDIWIAVNVFGLLSILDASVSGSPDDG